MKKYIICLFILSIFRAQAQNLPADAMEQSKVWYKLGVEYKDGVGVTMSYTKAFEYFSKASDLGDAQGAYAVAYMRYKGLGCTQDYVASANLFRKGAILGKDNSMYFYGLCLRNGYGTIKNEDSAKFWLQKSAELGYKQAAWELKMINPENGNDSSKALVLQISNAAIPNAAILNKYQKIENHLPASEIIAGYYKGYIIQYDWSGENIVSSKKLTLNLNGHSNSLEGFWEEEGIDSFKFKALLDHDSLIFENTKYLRRDHYSPDSSIHYTFKNAKLNLVQKSDSIFLAGNVEMFSPDRKEPSKPLFVALVRVDKIAFDKEEVKEFKATPNPFATTLNIDFYLPQATPVEVQLLSLNGTEVYSNPSAILDAGHYQLPLKPGFIASGVYFVKLCYGKRSAIIKVIKK